MKLKTTRLLILIGLILIGVFCVSQLRHARSVAPRTATTGTWRALATSDIKPDIGIELTRSADSSAGFIYLLDPHHPYEFPAGLRVPMMIRHFSDIEIHFTLAWPGAPRGFLDEMTLQFESPLGGGPIRATLLDCDRQGTPTEYDFVRYVAGDEPLQIRPLAGVVVPTVMFTASSNGIFAPTLGLRQISR